MTGGILQLVAKGVDDVFLVGIPQITFFKIVYRRYTNFSITNQLINFNHGMDFGSLGQTKIKRLADLVHKMYLIVDLPDIDLFYQNLTYNKLNEILTPVGIDIITLYYDTYGEQIPNMSALVSIPFYDTIVIPYITTTINKYIATILIAEEQLKLLNVSQQEAANKNKIIDINKYKNPANINKNSYQNTIKNYQGIIGNQELDTIFVPLPIRYQIYGNFIKEYISVNPGYKIIYDLYVYLTNLYNTIDSSLITMDSAATIKTLITTVTIDKTYMLNNINKLGHNDHNYYIGYNLLLRDTLNVPDNEIFVLPITQGNPISFFFENLINGTMIPNEILQNLDLYMIYNLLITNIAKTNPIVLSDNNIISVKNILVNIMSVSLQNNLSQFTTLLKLLNNFKFEYRTHFQTVKNVVMYGLFYSTTINYLTKFDSDKNIFFYDKNYASTPEGYYYTNWVKGLVGNFFNDLIDIFSGENTGNNQYIYLPYFDNETYASYYNLDPVDINPNHLSSILQGTNIKFNDPELTLKIKFLELTPFIVTHNLYILLNHSSNLYNVANPLPFIHNNFGPLSKYMDFLIRIYRAGLGTIENYIYNRTRTIINTTTRIITNLFTPNKVYSKKEIIEIIKRNPDVNPVIINLLGYIYVKYNVQTASIANVPRILFPLDAVMLMMAADILSDIYQPSVDISVYIAFMRMFNLYILSDIPPINITEIGTEYYGMINNTGYFNFVIDPNTNAVIRISSIWNNISVAQMDSFNNLFTRSLLSPDYYRKNSVSSGMLVSALNSTTKTPKTLTLTTNNNNTTSIMIDADKTVTFSIPESTNTVNETNAINDVIISRSFGYKYGIGATMEQAYRLFVHDFYNKSLWIHDGNNEHLGILIQLQVLATNFYAMEVIDPTMRMENAIVDITNDIINLIPVIENNILQFIILKKINEINVDSKLFYYNTLFNIMTQNIRSIDFQIENIHTEFSKVILNNVVPFGTIPETIDGYVSKLYKTFPLNHPQLDIIMGEIYNLLQIVPMNQTINLFSGRTYTSMLNPIPRKIINYRQPVTIPYERGVLDLMMHIENELFTDEPSIILNYYKKILNYFGTSISDSSNDFPPDVHIRTQHLPPATKYLKFLTPTNVTGDLYYNVAEGVPNTNPMNISNSSIVTLYNSFESVYGIIRCLLDVVIYDVAINNPTFPIVFGITTPETINTTDFNVDTLTAYYNELIFQTNKYLKIMTAPGTISFIGSPLYNRLLPLRQTLDDPNLRAEFAWSEWIGYNLIEYISVSIGGQLIDKHTGTWLYLDHLMNLQKNQQRGSDIMLGNVPELKIYNNTPKPKALLYVPMRFWFCKYFNAALPMICLRYADVEIELKLKNLQEVAFYDYPDTRFVKKPKLNARLMVDFVYLEPEERYNFSEHKHEYLIDVVQRNGEFITGEQELKESILLDNDIYHNQFNIAQSKYPSIYTEKRIYFSNMCKEMIWIFRFDKVIKTAEEIKHSVLMWTDYVLRNDTSIPLNPITTPFSISPNKAITPSRCNFKRKDVQAIQLKFNGIYREQWKPASYYNLVQPYKAYRSSLKGNIFYYTFALFPEYLQPSGAANMDQIQDLTIATQISQEIAEKIRKKEIVMKWDVYCRASNILRIMSGMAGMAFYGSQY
ncbi:MAG: NCLDV major capsid protein [Terrestrivirus sp.]|uniref:NCLDV major capsid protein n=1 Tax=Terrestrivirus sp. TaxID=2487775 RepID=A0A3G4ZLR2_9VIRU|nr:MAG: NCLDV major capsid protein [Terrestrivirus sp.]